MIPVHYPRIVIIWFIFQLLNFYEKYGKITIGGKIVPEIPEQRDMNTTEEMEP